MSIYNKSKKPLNWQQPKLSEGAPVRKSSHETRSERYHRQGTPITRRGPSALRPNKYHKELSPQLSLNKSQPTPAELEAFQKSWNDEVARVEKSRQAALDRAFARHMNKALGAPNVPLQPKQPAQVPGMGGHPMNPPSQEGQQGQQSNPQPKIPGVNQMAPEPQAMMGGQPGQQQPIGFTPDGMPIYPDPFHPAHQGFQAQQHQAAAQQQMGQGNPMAANVHEQNAMDTQSPMERAAANFANSPQGGPPQPTSKEPMGGRTLMPGQPQPNPAGSGMPLAKPAPPPMPQSMGEPGMGAPPGGAKPPAKAPEQKGTQQPYGVKADGEPDQGKPQAPPQPGPERDGPKPGMSEKPKAEAGPPSPEGGKEEGDQLKMLEALQQWLAQQKSPGEGAAAPAPGSSSQQEASGRPEKQTGQKSPLTHAATQSTPIEPTAKK